MSRGVLTFFCGKMGAGKSTESRRIAASLNAVLLSEDEWLATLFPEQIRTLSDYVKYAGLLRGQMKPLAQSILATGTDVVMDFPANTLTQRAWFREIFAEVGADHHLIYLDVPDARCIEQIRQRCDEQPERAATDTVEMFLQVTKYFEPPTTAEGFNLTKIDRAQ